MIILRQKYYSKSDLNKLGQETDKDIREAVAEFHYQALIKYIQEVIKK